MALPALKTAICQEQPWSVLHVVANHEKRVAEHLAVHSLEHYLPLYTEQSRWSDRIVQLERPLFIGYVFVRFAPQARTVLRKIPSVLHVLDGGTVSAEEIDRIREGLAGGCVIRPHPDVAVGTRVRISQGFFAGAEGIVTKFCQSCKVVMELTSTQQRFSVETNLENIEIPRETDLIAN